MKVCNAMGNKYCMPLQASIKDEVTMKNGMAIANNHSDTSAGVHQGLLNVNFLAQFDEFSDLADDFSNEGFHAKAAAAHQQHMEEIQKVESSTLQANPASLAKPAKRNGPPAKGKSFKMIKVATSPNNKNLGT